jgi:hypothetical protein
MLRKFYSSYIIRHEDPAAPLRLGRRAASEGPGLLLRDHHAGTDNSLD